MGKRLRLPVRVILQRTARIRGLETPYFCQDFGRNNMMDSRYKRMLEGVSHDVGWWGRSLYSPFLAQLIVTRQCNLACAYCNEFDKVSAPVPIEVLERRVDLLKALGTFSLELSGGEPLLHPELCRLIRHARSRGFFKVMMITNAVLLSPRKIDALNDAGLQEMQVSVDGVHPTGTTVKVLSTLGPKLEALARRARFPVVLSAVVGCTTTTEATEVIGYAKAHGFRARVLVIHGPDGQLRLGEAERASYRAIRSAVGRKFSEAGDYRTALLEKGEAPFKCRAGSRYLYVDESGMVRWCSQTRGEWGWPLEGYTARQLAEQFHTPKPCSRQCTVGCARTNSAADWWRPQSG